jgi:hypothetical protein
MFGRLPEGACFEPGAAMAPAIIAAAEAVSQLVLGELRSIRCRRTAACETGTAEGDTEYAKPARLCTFVRIGSLCEDC